MPPVDTPTKPTLRHLLRQATATDHAHLDAQLGSLDLTTADGYRRFLEINATALLPLERMLAEAGVARLLPDWPLRMRSRAILDDLAALGGTASQLDVPALPDQSAILGTLYVLEGSRLGAGYLIKGVVRSNEALVAGNTRFLGHGAGQNFWASFVNALEGHAETIDKADLIASAKQTFELFADAMAETTLSHAASRLQ